MSGPGVTVKTNVPQVNMNTNINGSVPQGNVNIQGNGMKVNTNVSGGVGTNVNV
jgi:hypothetical protein